MNRLMAALALAVLCQTGWAAEAIRPFTPGSFKEIQASRQGKPFVVMVWSLDCAYCAASFEALADAKKQHGLEVVTIATDPLDDTESARLIGKKLAAYRLTANAWAFGAAPPEQLRYAIDPKWRGELPRSYWFGRDGKVVARSGLVQKEMVSALLER